MTEIEMQFPNGEIISFQTNDIPRKGELLYLNGNKRINNGYFRVTEVVHYFLDIGTDHHAVSVILKKLNKPLNIKTPTK